MTSAEILELVDKFGNTCAELAESVFSDTRPDERLEIVQRSRRLRERIREALESLK